MRAETWIILPDAHVPFHNQPLMRKVCRLGHDLAAGLVISGDFLDLFSLSAYAADSLYQLKDVTLAGEYKVANKVLDELDAAFKGKKVYLFGNHEDRYFREIKKGDRGKYGSALVSPTEALRLHERDYTVLESWQHDAVRLGDHLEVIHGLYTTKYSAARHLDEFQRSVMFGHTHRAQSYYLGKRGAFGLGSLCDINSRGFDYMPRPQRMKWSNSFGLVVIDGNGNFHAQVIHCQNGHFYAAGRLY